MSAVDKNLDVSVGHDTAANLRVLVSLGRDVCMLRLATLDDLSAIDDLANQVLEEHRMDRDSAVQSNDAVYFVKGAQTDPPLCRFWVAELGADIIGSVAIVAIDPDTCLLKTFYVDRRFRHRGLGWRLYRLADEFARTAGFGVIRLYSSRRFQRAAAFYLRNSFQLEERTNNAWEDDRYALVLSREPQTGGAFHA